MLLRCPDRPILTPTLLGRDGLLRAFTLVREDRPGLTLQAWIAETASHAARRDRDLDGDGGPPRQGLVGLVAPTGCVFGVFDYSADDAPGVLAVRGPSLSAPLGGRLVPARLDCAIARLAGTLGCPRTRRRPW